MNSIELIEKVLAAKSYRQIFNDAFRAETLYQEYIKLIHPDICSNAGAVEASAKLNSMRDEINKGFVFKDDAGKITYIPFLRRAFVVGRDDLLQHSKRYYDILDRTNEHFIKYIPLVFDRIRNPVQICFVDDCLPLSRLPNPLPQEHVNWITSRMLELVAWFAKEGYVHAGINPDSIWVVPETHGIICTSFYHMQKEGDRLKTISARYKGFYPDNVFREKIARTDLDIELVKRTVAYLLGDRSGNGSILRRTHNIDFVEFLLNYDNDSSYEVYKKYRELLSKNFKKQFIPLEV